MKPDTLHSGNGIAKRSEEFVSRLHIGRTLTDRVADWLTQQFGSVGFLVFNVAVFLAWIEWNVGWFGFEPFEPYPFGLLTMIVSLEAIILAIIVLISQNRQSRIADLRQKMDFEIDVRAEAETKKMLIMMEHLHRHLGVSPEPAEKAGILDATDIERIRERIEEESDY
jgi:uncharacterized membrane protein